MTEAQRMAAERRLKSTLRYARRALSLAEIVELAQTPSGDAEALLAAMQESGTVVRVRRGKHFLWKRPGLAEPKPRTTILDRLWSELRRQPNSRPLHAIAKTIGATEAGVHRELRALLKAGYVVQDSVKSWRIFRNTGPSAPKAVVEASCNALVRGLRDGNNGELYEFAISPPAGPTLPPRPIGRDAIERIWSAFRVLGRCDLPMLSRCAHADEAETASYLQLLVRSGYAAEQGSGLRLVRNTGPFAPRRCITQLQDTNTGKLYPLGLITIGLAEPESPKVAVNG